MQMHIAMTVVVDDHIWRLELHRIETVLGNVFWSSVAEAISGPSDGKVIYEGGRHASKAAAEEAGLHSIMDNVNREHVRREQLKLESV